MAERIEDISAQPKDPAPRSHAPPLVLWLAAQLGALALAAAQFQLGARTPKPYEALALTEMLTVQIAISGIAFPLLMRRVSTGLILAATTWPFLQLAGVLSATPVAKVVLVCGYMSLWLVGLNCWRWALAKTRGMAIGLAVTTAMVAFWPMLYYFHQEFTPVGESGGTAWGMNPLNAALNLAAGDQNLLNWAAAVSVLVCGLGAVGLRGYQSYKTPASASPEAA